MRSSSRSAGQAGQMKQRLTIGRLAMGAGVPRSTVRYYERRRILQPEGRTQGNYRIYSPGALERLRFIRAAQTHGFTLNDIETLFAFRDGRTAPCKEVQNLIVARLSDLDERVEQLHQVQAVLRASLRMCRRAERSGRCKVIERLSLAPSPSPEPRLRTRPRKKSRIPP